MKHEDSGNRCLLFHGKREPQCIVCKHCGDKVRPEDMDGECQNDAPQWRRDELNWKPK